MRIKMLALAFAVMAMPIMSQAQQSGVPAPSLFSIRAGEKMLLRLVGAVTANCEDLFISLESVDILESPQEIFITFEQAPVRMTVNGKMCQETGGGHLMIAASNEIYFAKEANLVIRLRYKSQGVPNNSWTIRWHLLLYPAGPSTPKSNGGKMGAARHGKSGQG